MIEKLTFLSNGTEEADAAQDKLVEIYGNCIRSKKSDVIVALGGDGFMLQTLHEFMNSGKPYLWNEQGNRWLSDERIQAFEPQAAYFKRTCAAKFAR